MAIVESECVFVDLSSAWFGFYSIVAFLQLISLEGVFLAVLPRCCSQLRLTAYAIKSLTIVYVIWHLPCPRHYVQFTKHDQTHQPQASYSC